MAVLDSAPEVVESTDAVELPMPVRGAVVFEAVAFGYRSGSPVLREINLEIPPNSSLALVGPSGTGKTTLASLLLRFYDPTKGRITLDGQDLRGLTLVSLRRNIALVSQDPILFAASIRENISYGHPKATEEQIMEAARNAGAHDFIQSMPDGYETRIAERGANLSTGQRQRLAIARAFLKDAPILILDEPTSALDARTEGALMQALEGLMKGRTTLIIAHRLSTVRRADRIVVMQDGLIKESGSHDELLARGDLYAHLYELQFGEIEAVGQGMLGGALSS
jgi:ABC-type multidrug transport system fused ATPase/permease subunit